MKNNGKFLDNTIVESLYKRAIGFYYSEEQLEFGEKTTKVDEKEKEQNSVSKNSNFENHGVCLSQENEDEAEKQLELDENKQTLVLLKKKVTTHYIPPDMLAIKMLVENFGQALNGQSEKNKISNLSDDELLVLKKKIEKEIVDFET